MQTRAPTPGPKQHAVTAYRGRGGPPNHSRTRQDGREQLVSHSGCFISRKIIVCFYSGLQNRLQQCDEKIPVVPTGI